MNLIYTRRGNGFELSPTDAMKVEFRTADQDGELRKLSEEMLHYLNSVQIAAILASRGWAVAPERSNSLDTTEKA